MAHIKITRRHSMAIDELLVQLKPAVAESAAKFDLHIQWSGRTCMFSGAALGYLKVSENSLILAARLIGYVALLHRKMIETEISRALDSVIR